MITAPPIAACVAFRRSCHASFNLSLAALFMYHFSNSWPDYRINFVSLYSLIMSHYRTHLAGKRCCDPLEIQPVSHQKIDEQIYPSSRNGRKNNVVGWG